MGGVYGTVGGDVKIAVGSSSAFGITALNNGNVGVGFAATTPTHTLTLGPGNTGIVSYNNAAGLDAGVTNYERVRTVWGGNVYNVISEAGGTGVARTIRTATPTSLFDVGAQEVRYSQYNANPGIVVSRYNGTIASPTQVVSGQQIGGFYLNGYTSAGAIGSNVGAFQFFATENFTGTAQGTRFAIAVTPTGSTGRVDRLTIENDGATTINGNLTSNQFKLSALNTAPASASATGTAGEIRVTAGYIYVCVATNTWVRSALTTW